MALKVTQGAVGTQTFSSNPDTVIRSVNPKVFFLQAKIAPLLTMLKRIKKGSNPTSSSKFEWVEKDQGTPIATLTVAALVGDATLTVSAAEGDMFRANDLIFVPSTGEIIKVVSESAGTVTVTGGRGYGTTAAAGIALGATIILLGAAFAEGTTSPEGMVINPTMPFNYTQIFKDSVEITRTAAQTDRYDVNNPQLVQRRKDSMIFHMESIERAFLWGEKKIEVLGANARRATAGVRNFITTNLTNVGGVFTKAKFDAFLANIFLYGEGQKVLFASSDLLAALHAEVFTNSNMQIIPSTKEWGLDIRKYLSPYGTIEIAYHRILSQVLPGYGYALDLDYLTMKDLQPTRVKTNVQAPDYDGFKDEILTETGLEFACEKQHGIIYNV